MPDSLPSSLCPLISEFRIEGSSSQRQTNIAAGAPTFELWTTDNVSMYTLSFMLDYARYRIFHNFFHQTLKNGSLWFEMDLPVNDPTVLETLETHFMAGSTFSPSRVGKLWAIKMNVVALNPDISEDQDYLDSLNDIIAAFGSVAEARRFMGALEDFTLNYLPDWTEE